MIRLALRGVGVLIATVALVFGSIVLAAPAMAYFPVPVNTSAATITGTPVVGNVLTANTGGWNGQPPLSFSFAWSTPSTPLLGSDATYTPVSTDVGQILTVRITATDGNNNSTAVDVSTTAVTVSDVVSKVAPKLKGGLVVGDTMTLNPGKFTSGSGPLTYVYAWSTTNGQTTKPLTDVGLSHLITAADLGDYIEVTITATSSTQHNTATVKTPGVVVPVVPFKTSAGLTKANKGTLTGKTSKNVATITDPGGAAGDGAFVYAYSTPSQLGWFALGTKKQFTVDYSSLSPGEHKLVVMDQAGAMVGWLAVVRSSDGPVEGAVNPVIAVIAGAVLVLGILLIVIMSRVRRRRQPSHRD